MECLIHSPAFNTVKMAWVAGVGATEASSVGGLELDLLRDREANSRNPRHFNIIEGGRVYQALHIDSKSVLDALCRVKKCFRHSI